MSLAWEVTDEDIIAVLAAHGIHDSDQVAEAEDILDADAVEEAVLSYTDFDDQVSASLTEIEDQLFEHGLLSGERKFANGN